MVNFEKIQPIAKRVIDKYSRSGLMSLDPRDRVFFLISMHAGELSNGGYCAFFYNSEADNYTETIEALTSVGLDLSASLLTRVGTILFNGVVPRDMTERNEIIAALADDTGINEELESLDRQFYVDGGGDRELEVLERWYFKGQGDVNGAPS